MLWSTKYLTGNKEIDNDHKEIFAMVKDIIDQNFIDRGEKITKVMEFLAQYTIRHFAREEALMKESNYPDIEEHKQQHAEFVKAIGALIEKIKTQGDTINISIEVNDTAVGWLVSHVLGSDKKMAEYYKEWKQNK